MIIKIRIRTGNAAFEDGYTEVARLLTEIAQRFKIDGPFVGPLYDINGNKVGSVKAEEY